MISPPGRQCSPALEVGDVGLHLGQHRDALVEFDHLGPVKVIPAEDQIGAEFFGMDGRTAPGGVVGSVGGLQGDADSYRTSHDSIPSVDEFGFDGS